MTGVTFLNLVFIITVLAIALSNYFLLREVNKATNETKLLVCSLKIKEEQSQPIFIGTQWQWTSDVKNPFTKGLIYTITDVRYNEENEMWISYKYADFDCKDEDKYCAGVDTYENFIRNKQQIN